MRRAVRAGRAVPLLKAARAERAERRAPLLKAASAAQAEPVASAMQEVLAVPVAPCGATWPAGSGSAGTSGGAGARSPTISACARAISAFARAISASARATSASARAISACARAPRGAAAAGNGCAPTASVDPEDPETAAAARAVTPENIAGSRWTPPAPAVNSSVSANVATQLDDRASSAAARAESAARDRSAIRPSPPAPSSSTRCATIRAR